MTSPFGVYLHIPFCAKRCDYCAFATWTDRGHLEGAYLDALESDVAAAIANGRLPIATSVFVGGGTPSLVDPHRLAEVLRTIPVVKGAEVTVECNPDTVTPSTFVEYVDGGVNRISFGVQSMVPHVLAALGRTHDPDSVARAVRWARDAGITQLNLDLIYGGAGESIDDWRASVERAIGLRPDHISAYALTVEAGTPLAEDPFRHPDDDDQADKYLLADRLLAEAGFHNYEISNWSRPGCESRHNFLYWRQGEYLGFGCAAHSHVAGRRWWNVRTPDRYIDAVATGVTTEAASEELDRVGRRIEGLQLSLRTNEGIPVDALSEEDLVLLDGLVERAGDHLVLTVEGRLLANEVAVRIR
jgi:putative oxygen-independent coproporphyrinogen III oxidase